MAKSSWDGKIPYIGNVPQVYVGYQKVDWRDNIPFQDTLTFTTFNRGRSAARAVFKSQTLDCCVEIFLSDLVGCMSIMKDGMIEGTFHFTKCGSNFGIRNL